MPDFFDGSGRGGSVDVGALLDSGVPGVLAALCELGCLVSLGRTRDGGALGVTVTRDGRWRREYFRDAEELTNFLLEAVAACEAAGPPTASSAPGPRNRSRS